ncbi:DNA ligase 6 isoform X1 [Canna indica]|uniref:DNA ligase n=1 Tax=Canna indica TaxID=4628 RepID=A0AAQ3JXJ8_9LILI|nr:DNA ligase 6 isoform X1 [Canna indica]
MAAPPSFSSSPLFLSSYRSFSSSLLPPFPPPSPPVSFRLLSDGSPLPPIPSDFPLPKLIPRTRFVVDGFRSAGDFSVSYFLSHFHADHYAGLGSAWCKGVIFCSATTARLLIEILNVPPFFVVSLSLGEVVVIDGWEVAAIDANHCPGAVQFLFRTRPSEGQRPERYIHTGDFRFCESMRSDPILCEFVGADAVFLDTTYCNPNFVFPAQEESIEYIVRTIKRIKEQNKESGQSVLFLIATYVIGKERILLEISRQCGCLLQVDSRKMQILSVLGFGGSGDFTEDVCVSDTHVISWNLLGETWPYFRPNFVKMKEIMVERGYSKAVGFISTGWMYETKRDGFSVRVKDCLEIHLVPYSEHSNYNELREYVRFLRPKQVIPTVGMDTEKLDSKHSLALRKHFAGLVDETANKHDFLMAFHQKSDGAELISGDDMTIHANWQEDVDTVENPPVVSILSIQQQSDSKDLNMSNVEDLKDCLPSWVKKDQLLDLLERSNGDIVDAVSEFFEHETEFYKQANATKNSIVNTCKNINNNIDSLLAVNTIRKVPESGIKNFLHKVKQSRNQSLSMPIPPPSRKRGSGGGNKIKKKAKGCSSLDTTRGKQSTITSFFRKVSADTSTNDASAVTSDQKISNSRLMQIVSAETYKEELDQFLHIINDGIPRKSAAMLLEKAKGNIDLAVDMYYSGSHNILENERNLVSDNASGEKGNSASKVDVLGVHLKKCTEKVINSSVDKISLPTLYLQESSREEKTETNVSLPIEKYSPTEHACWKSGEPAPYLHLARTFDLVEREKGKIKTTAMLCNMFRSLLALSHGDVLPALYLCTNKIGADHENMELNVGGSLVVTALEEACGTSRSRIKEMYNTFGDLGDVAQGIQQTQSLLAPPRPLSIHHLFHKLRELSVITGSGSALRRRNLVVNLMRSCREMEIKFLVRTLVHNLRIGAMMKTILPALAQAVVLNSLSPLHCIEGVSESTRLQLQGISSAVSEAYNLIPNLDLLIPSLLSKGLEFSASSLEMVPGNPIPPMLARITNGVTQVMKLFEGKAFSCEYKYDGQRAQIHKLSDGSIRVFSRQMKETTSRFPDLVNIIKDSCKTESSTFILDAEVVAVDRKCGGKLMSFQELSSRERGNKDSSIGLDKIRVNICVFIFDIMLYNGERLLDFPLRQRRKYVKDLFLEEKAGYLEFAKEITVEADEACLSNQISLARINLFFEDARNSSCEGIMVKTLDVDAGYSASKRTEAWLKVKRDYIEGLGDSLDLVPIGAWHGNGRKAGWYSPFLMACYNPDAEEFQSVCRVMSGFSDSFYIEMKEFFSGERLLLRKPSYYQTDESPDLWFPPELVWEIRGAAVQISQYLQFTMLLLV